MIDKLRWPLFAPLSRVLVAVSGGPDSLCLLHVLWSEAAARGLGAVTAAHLDHGLRGDESAQEAAWVADWCAARGIACQVGGADVTARGRGRQAAARDARYAFLEEARARAGADLVATAHTRDDQAETVLMRVLRGTGPDGLAGIPARRGRVVRPLLDVSRAEVVAYCRAHGLEPRRDPSNSDAKAYTRNRVRLELLPRLAREYNPAVRDALVRLSQVAARDADCLGELAAHDLARVTRSHQDGGRVLDRAGLAGLHPAMRRRVLRLALTEVRGTDAGITYEHTEQVCAALADAGGRPFGLTLPAPACTVSVDGGDVAFALVPAPQPPVWPGEVPLAVPGVARLPQGGAIRAAWEDGAGAVALDADALDLPTLHVRFWRPGDRIDPQGMGGRHKKLSDVFTDAKVPRADRGRVPVAADARGPVWAAGLCLGERARATDGTARRLFLSREQEHE